MGKITVPRKDYLDHLMETKDITHVVKIITGMRRCGKTTLISQMMEKIRNEGNGESIVYMDLESKEFKELVNFRDLNKYLESRMNLPKRYYVFLDELQRIDGWERVGNSLMVDYDADVYIISSNDKLSNTEYSTYMAGRYIEIKMVPPSFKEYTELHPVTSQSTIEKRFSDYLNKGAIPIIDPDSDISDELLEGICSSALVFDVAKHMGTIDARISEDVVSYLMSNIGKITSNNEISKALSITIPTTKRYIKGLEDAYIINKVERYDIRRDRTLYTSVKYYATDLGMRNSISGRDAEQDMDKVLENVVYLELLRRGYKVYAGSYYDKEIDFVAIDFRTRKYYQVVQRVWDEPEYRRKKKALVSIKDNYPKIILTLDRLCTGNDKGIQVMNLIDWLYGKE